MNESTKGKYVFGFDFGTLSCRGVAVDWTNGQTVAVAESPYKNGVISGQMKHKPIKLEDEWFLQDPEDWLDSMAVVSRALLKNGTIKPEDVISLGTDFTSCTLVPIKCDGTPLCKIETFRDKPNAWPKLWKHHGAQKQAEIIEAYAKQNTTWLKEYFGNGVSSEWLFPKVMQVAEENPEIYEETDYFIEAVDYIVMCLTGVLTRNKGILGVNAFWTEKYGYPSNDFCRAINPLLENLVEQKLSGTIVTVGDLAGSLTFEASHKLGLTTNTVVASGHSDSAVTGCGAGITKSGDMTIVMGTSTCHQMLYQEFKPFEGVCSIAADGMIPGLYGYESGQPATGDIFEWFIKNCVPERYFQQAVNENKSILNYLGQLASELMPGECGLIALDWLNGNRSILTNYNLSGLIVGLTLQTKPEEIYRALVEANIFGSKKILNNYERNGVTINHIYIVGGIANKGPWIMQMCADVFGREVYVPQIENIPARGAAACATVAVNKKNSQLGMTNFDIVAKAWGMDNYLIYYPNKQNEQLYQNLFQHYEQLHHIFGENDALMRNLKTIRKQCKQRKDGDSE